MYWFEKESIVLGISELKWTGMDKFNSDGHYIYYCWQESLRRNGVALIVNKSPKCSIRMQSQNWKNDLSLFLRQIIQHHSNPSLCSNHWCQRSWNWMALWRATRPSRTTNKKKGGFHHRGLEFKSRKSRDTCSDRQVWSCSTKLSRTKLTEFCQNVLVIANTLFQQHKRWLYTWTSPDGQYRNQIDYVRWRWRWKSSLQWAEIKPVADWGSDHELMSSLLQNSGLNWRK